MHHYPKLNFKTKFDLWTNTILLLCTLFITYHVLIELLCCNKCTRTTDYWTTPSWLIIINPICWSPENWENETGWPQYLKAPFPGVSGAFSLFFQGKKQNRIPGAFRGFPGIIVAEQDPILNPPQPWYPPSRVKRFLFIKIHKFCTIVASFQDKKSNFCFRKRNIALQILGSLYSGMHLYTKCANFS